MKNAIAEDRLRLPSFDCPNPYCTAKNIAFAPNAESKNRSELIPIEALEEIDDAEFIVNCPKCRRQFALIRHHSYACHSPGVHPLYQFCDNLLIEYFGIVSRPPTRECGSKGQVSSPKKNHAAAETARDLWLDACLCFYQFCKNESRLKCKTEKSCAWSNGFYIRTSIDPWPKIRGNRFLPRSETCWGVCLPQTQQNERNDHFSHPEVFKKCEEPTIRPSAVM